MANKSYYDKIDKIEVFMMRSPPLGKAKFWSSQTAFPERNSMLVKVTSGDLSGWGEAGHYGPAEPVAAAIEHVLGQRIIGKSIQPAVIYDDLYNYSRDFGQRGTYVEAISGIDVALWDLLGKKLGVPVCKLLGGAFRTRVKVYATGCYYKHNGDDASTLDVVKERAEAVAEAKKFKDAGFKGMKMKVGLLRVDDDAKRVAAVRAAIGPDMKLMIDGNHAHSVPSAVRLAKAVEKYDITWFEEPVIPEDIEGYHRLQAQTHIPIAGGEASFTRYGFRDLFCGPKGPCMSFAQPDISAAGGLSEFAKIATLASTFGVTIIPHVWGSAVAVAAGLHAVASLPLTPHTANPSYLENECVMEFDRNPNALRDELLVGHKFTLGEDGALAVPMDRPGLGIVVDEAAVKRFTVPAGGKARL